MTSLDPIPTTLSDHLRQLGLTQTAADLNDLIARATQKRWSPAVLLDIRIDAKRQALDALDNLRRGSDAANGNGKPANDAEIETIVEVPGDLTSQFAFAGLATLR